MKPRPPKHLRGDPCGGSTAASVEYSLAIAAAWPIGRPWSFSHAAL